ncbi:MAG: S9 family peptidase [Acidobacteria bacterium]|nr:S9 family peptidase [Acidobacteriota bacterium]
MPTRPVLSLSTRAAAAGLAASLSLALAPPAAAETHPFSVRDMVAMERLGDPKPSPDGRWAVYTKRVWDEAANKNSTSLWLAALDGSSVRHLTSAPHVTDSSPTWSPDSRSIAFTSTRGGSSQIWSIAIDGGEATPIAALPVDVDNLAWSPDGSRIAFTADVYPDCPDLACTAKRDDEKAASPVKARTFTHLMIRHWDTWFDGKRGHIFTLPLRPLMPPAAAGAPVDLLQGLDFDAPTKPFGGAEEFAWSPDGKEIAFTSNMSSNPGWSTDSNIYTVAATGGPLTCVTKENAATDTAPAYAPDGSSIAYLAMQRPGYEADRQRVVLYDRRDGKRRVLTEGWDRSAGSLAWAPGGKALLVTATDTARQRVFSIDPATSKITTIVADHYNSGVAPVMASGGPGAGRIVFAQDSLTSPAEIFTARLDGTDLRRLTHANDDRLASARLSAGEEFWFAGAGGTKVHGWIFRPVDFKEGSKYPLAFLIHGGPQGSWEDHFHYRWNPEAYAGAGYATVAIDPRGSTGYGQAFTDGINGDWGGKPYDDLMKGLDHVLASYAWVDGTRMGAAGASYGGYMVNWIAGHTDRFKCLVSHDGAMDEYASYYATEELWFPEWEYMGTPYEHPELYEKWSPDRYVSNWKTPMLVVHSAKDYRLPETEGFSAFTALQRRGIPSMFLYFPDENHWVLKAKNSILWHETVIGWLDRWLKG